MAAEIRSALIEVPGADGHVLRSWDRANAVSIAWDEEGWLTVTPVSAPNLSYAYPPERIVQVVFEERG